MGAAVSFTWNGKGAIKEEYELCIGAIGQTGTSSGNEITAAVGMLMLQNKGRVTVNTHGQSGGRVSIRPKPTSGAVARAGGAQAVAACVYDALKEVSDHLEQPNWFAELLFGEA